MAAMGCCVGSGRAGPDLRAVAVGAAHGRDGLAVRGKRYAVSREQEKLVALTFAWASIADESGMARELPLPLQGGGQVGLVFGLSRSRAQGKPIPTQSSA